MTAAERVLEKFREHIRKEFVNAVDNSCVIEVYQKDAVIRMFNIAMNKGLMNALHEDLKGDRK